MKTNLRTRLTISFLWKLLLFVFVICGALISTGIVSLIYYQQHVASVTDPTSHALDILRQMPSNTLTRGKTIHLSSAVLSEVSQHGGWLQILNEQGRELFSFHVPPTIPQYYSPGRLVYFHEYPNTIGYKLFIWYAQVQGHQLTWIYGLPFTDVTGSGHFGAVFVACVTLLSGTLITFLVAMMLAWRLGVPLLHMLTWLQVISSGIYEEPRDRNGVPRSRTKHGLFRAQYRLYREVIYALDHLADTLKRSETERKRLEASREEWITGISHDMKTPLSSVKGFSQLLATTDYTWTPEEIHEFATVMLDKSTHMENLINDLSLTLRLKNDALPLRKQEVDVVELTRSCVENLVADPHAQGYEIRFDCNEPMKVLYSLDPRWFKRAVDNLLGNAVLHNPPGTTIIIHVETVHSERDVYPGFVIRISDNGTGMDEDTLRHLFDRYYRGTNTETATGSGLGTAIAKQLVEAHGGSVAVYSQVNHGTAVYITLPAIH